jgi:uncharacterized OB-fold protein
VNGILPVVDDVDTAGFWEAARRGELAVRACDRCGHVLHLPRAYCHQCGSWANHWNPVAGQARLQSWTTVVHQVHPSFPPPYTIVLVELVDHPSVRLVGRLQGEPPLRAGQAMQVSFETLEDGTVLPQWHPSPPA